MLTRRSVALGSAADERRRRGRRRGGAAAAIAFALAFALLAGCTAEGAGTSNFTLTPNAIGWYVGDDATFTLAIASSILHSSPSFVIDRQFAIEKIEFAEKGLTFGHDHATQDPNDVDLRLERNGTAGERFTMDEAHPRLDVVVKVPGDLRDSEYTLELKLFKVGTVKSDKFRVDVR